MPKWPPSGPPAKILTFLKISFWGHLSAIRNGYTEVALEPSYKVYGTRQAGGADRTKLFYFPVLLDILEKNRVKKKVYRKHEKSRKLTFATGRAAKLELTRMIGDDQI